MTDHIVTGLMSGSSLDGVDLATIRFSYSPDPDIPLHWSILAAETLPYPGAWQDLLASLPHASALDLAKAHAGLGQLYGQMIRDFHLRYLVTPDLVASHGHTVFHHPNGDPGFSTQIGDGAYISSYCGLPVVCDFRNADIARGGQGGPMAPLADKLLFPGYSAWINLGGIVNISVNLDGEWSGWDVYACNQLLNALANEAGLTMDQDGLLARKGILQVGLMDKAMAHGWLTEEPPKTLDNQEVKREITRMFLNEPGRLEDKLHTAVECIRMSLVQAMPKRTAGDPGKVLITGGGARNGWLMKRLMDGLRQVHWLAEAPDDLVIDFKESALIALAGLWRWLGKSNFIPGVTGASSPVCGGAVYLPGNTYLRS